MVGFFTLLSFVAALAGGGWFWLGFVIMLGVWGSKLQEEKKTQIPTPPTPPVNEPQGLPSPRPSIPSTQYPVSEWSRRLTETCAQYASGDFYVAELIPQNKLENALKKYPLNGGGQAIALIDATVFGSAENGMLIGEYGLSWHHSSGHSKISTMPWTEFSELAVSVEGSKIKIGNDAIFETAGTQLDKKIIKSLLERIGDLWLATVLNPPPYETEPTRPMPVPPVSPPPKLDKTDVNCADFDSLLALPGIGVPDAKLLIQHRDSNGPLASMHELAAVLKLKPHIVERLRPLVTFTLTRPSPLEPPKTPRPSNPPSEPHPPHNPMRPRAPVDF